jgi:hypothetical protein
MANALSITDGTTTISLSSSGCLLTRYVPTAPDLDADGNYRPITEAAEFFISDSSAANVQAKIGSIERLLQDAVRAQSGLCAPVYLQFQTGADAAAWRSEIMSYRLLLGEDASVNLYQQRMDCRLIVTRRHYWEGAEAELELSTSNQAAATGGRTIYNHDDAGTGHDNWVQIATAQVTGALPAGTRIQIGNGAGSVRTWRRLYVALNALSDPANFSHILEAEARLSGGTIQANAAASNGSEVTFTLSASSVTIQWSISATLLADAAGRMFRILAAVNGASGTPSGTAQIAVRNWAGTNLWKGDTVPMPSAAGLLDLGAIPLPPGGYSTTYGELRLALVITGTGTWKIDYLQLTPTDGIALLGGISPTGLNEYAVMDSIEEREYLLQSPSSQFPYVILSGERIYLHPSRLQRLIILADSAEANVAIDDTFTVRAWIRPRRLTV